VPTIGPRQTTGEYIDINDHLAELKTK